MDARLVVLFGMANRPAAALLLSDDERERLGQIARSMTAPHRVVTRAQALLEAAEGVANSRIADGLGVSRSTVLEWRSEWEVRGLADFGRVQPGRGRKPSIPDTIVEAVVHDTLHVDPPDGATQWTCRSMAQRHGISSSTVGRIWRARKIRPHLVRKFKLSNDPNFEAKLRDVVGVYLNPPKRAVVFSVDEKTQVQALDRTQPSLPMTPGRAGTMTHDYKRNGTTDLFAALNIATGEVVGDCYDRHSHVEFIRFLNRMDRAVPKGMGVHVILDNAGSHSTPEVDAWLARHKRFHFHFTPTSSSWLNLVEGWFAQLTNRRIRRGRFKNVPALINAIQEHIATHNNDPKPFIWTATADDILAKVGRARAASTNRPTNKGTDH
jgi:transposase